MEQKETIAQLLKEFRVKKVYSPAFGDVEFVGEQLVKDIEMPTIRVKSTNIEGDSVSLLFLHDGRYTEEGECQLFIDRDYTPITRSELEKRFPELRKKPIKTWEDIIEQEREDNFSYVYETLNCYYYANERLHRHAIAEAKISQILAQGSYEVWKSEKDGRWCCYISIVDLEVSVFTKIFFSEPTNILRFKTRKSAEDFLSHDSNKKLAKDYLMRE
jgi:hypothetical protein